MPRQLPNLDLLRSIAVLVVVLDHLCLALRMDHLGPLDLVWLGRFGVDLFFVHTALVLMWSLERKPHTLDFYIRRVFRIYPLAWVAILMVYFTHAPVGLGVWFQWQPLTHLFLLKNMLLIQDLWYAPPAEAVLWTLPLEVQMYIVLPLLFFYVRHQRVLWVLLLLWGLTVAFCRGSFPPDHPQNLADSVPMFLAGVMAYVCFQTWRSRIKSWLFAPAIAVLFAIFMEAPSIKMGWVVTLALGLLLPLFHQITARWLIRASYQVAKYSYGIYLGHPFGLVLGIYLLPGRGLLLQLSITTFFIAIISIAAYHLIEKPLINLGSRVAARVEFKYEHVVEIA